MPAMDPSREELTAASSDSHVQLFSIIWKDMYSPNDWIVLLGVPSSFFHAPSKNSRGPASRERLYKEAWAKLMGATTPIERSGPHDGGRQHEFLECRLQYRARIV